MPTSPSPCGVGRCSSRTAYIQLSARFPQSTIRVMITPSRGCRGGDVRDYPPPAARASPSSTSSLGREAVADEALLVLVTSWLGFLRGGVAGLGLAAGADPSLSSSSLSSSKLNVGWRWRLWTVAKLRASSSRSKRFSGFLFAVRLASFLPISLRSKKALFHQDAFSSSSTSSSSFFS